MIDIWSKTIIYVTLHDKHLTDKYKEMYPDKPDFWDSPIDVDIEEIYRLEKTNEGKAIIWIPRDDQGGGMSIEVLEDYDELYSSVWTGWWILEGLELGCCDNSKFPVFFNISDTNVKVNYVHELQHALKLCGIEKEIVL